MNCQWLYRKTEACLEIIKRADKSINMNVIV